MAAMSADGGTRPTALRVDGGMARNDWVLQFLADILQLPVEPAALFLGTPLLALELFTAAGGIALQLLAPPRRIPLGRLAELLYLRLGLRARSAGRRPHAGGGPGPLAPGDGAPDGAARRPLHGTGGSDCQLRVPGSLRIW